MTSIIFHELTHVRSRTDDKAYGATDDKSLAKKSPKKAVRNADNYEFFATGE